MHDIRAIRENPTAFDAALERRNLSPASRAILAVDVERRDLQTRLQGLQAFKKQVSNEIARLRRLGQNTEAEQASSSAVDLEMRDLEASAKSSDERLTNSLASLPNRLDDDVPDGFDERHNVVLKQWGDTPSFDFTPRQHFELGEALGMMDFETAAKMSGARFTILRGPLARLERALGQFMLDLHTTEHGYTETIVPLLVNDAAAYGTDKLPKFGDTMFHTEDARWLIPTAEVPLTYSVAGDILAEKQLPIRITALSECFRSEAGAAGRDTRGYLRQHQFRKVELVSITTPEQSDTEHERMTSCAETVLERLGLPYRRVFLCAGDTGFGAARTYDLEVWLPGQGMWREISSCSNTRAFQARRMNARYRAADGKTVGFVHTLNGSGTAVGRCLIAVMENYQQPNGSIAIPEALRPWMGGIETIAK